MIKKLTPLLLAGCVLSTITATALASDHIQAQLFPAAIIQNGIKKEIPAETPILNFNGHAYAPVRLIAENEIGEVSYEESTNSIYIDSVPGVEGKSVIHSSKVEKDFEITIHSAKNKYKEGDLLQVWGEFKYLGDMPVTLFSPYPISYSIKNKVGREYGQIRTLAKLPTIFNLGDTTLLGSPHSLVTMYNFYESGISDSLQFFQQTKRPRVLPKGEYTISLIASFLVENVDSENPTPFRFNTEIPIVVE